MSRIKGLDDRVVEMVPCGIFVACRYAVARHHSSVKDFIRVKECRQCRLQVIRIKVCVVQQPLGYIHADIYYLWEIGMLLRFLKRIALFENLDLIGFPFVLRTALCQVYCKLEPCFTECGLVKVFLKFFDRFYVENYIESLREGSIWSSGPAHVDKSFLECNYGTAGYHSSPVKDKGLTRSCFFHRREKSREIPALAYLYPWLYHIFDRNYPGPLSRAGQVYFNFRKTPVFRYKGFSLFFVDEKGTAVSVCLFGESKAGDVYLVQFQPHLKIPPLLF